MASPLSGSLWKTTLSGIAVEFPSDSPPRTPVSAPRSPGGSGVSGSGTAALSGCAWAGCAWAGCAWAGCAWGATAGVAGAPTISRSPLSEPITLAIAGAYDGAVAFCCSFKMSPTSASCFRRSLSTRATSQPRSSARILCSRVRFKLRSASSVYTTGLPNLCVSWWREAMGERDRQTETERGETEKRERRLAERTPTAESPAAEAGHEAVRRACQFCVFHWCVWSVVISDEETQRRVKKKREERERGPLTEAPESSSSRHPASIAWPSSRPAPLAPSSPLSRS